MRYLFITLFFAANYSSSAWSQIELRKKSFFKALVPDEFKAEAYTQSHQSNFNEEYAVKPDHLSQSTIINSTF